MPDQPIGLTLEQQFSLRSFADQVEKMSLDQAQAFLLKLYGHMLAREAMYKHLLQHEWGINPPTLDQQQEP